MLHIPLEICISAYAASVPTTKIPYSNEPCVIIS
jgi:hypothetical protein